MNDYGQQNPRKLFRRHRRQKRFRERGRANQSVGYFQTFMSYPHQWPDKSLNFTVDKILGFTNSEEVNRELEKRQKRAVAPKDPISSSYSTYCSVDSVIAYDFQMIYLFHLIQMFWFSHIERRGHRRRIVFGLFVS